MTNRLFFSRVLLMMMRVRRRMRRTREEEGEEGEDDLFSDTIPSNKTGKLEDELANNGGYFSKFDWVHDPYDSWMAVHAKEKKVHKEKIEDIHGN